MREDSQADESELLRAGKSQPGVRADSYIDGRARRWSWGCKCGEWDDGIPTRDLARHRYREHKKECVIEPVIAYPTLKRFLA